ncbi:hypothetical protein Lfu02_67670 [Longispora fulva]|uniref:DUF3352 domain-containing protein n=1 Tax=Longispora fulva TaxID=619741 RepID=A0A8J7KKT1_9ACTN|nr:hypothetical protein [Longispora fulva]MBG6138499.1 hypothetical protein [Longispora fulva]GIG62395.1 hypothetical protein Lfu02_67670 [Longispora fulva]
MTHPQDQPDPWSAHGDPVIGYEQPDFDQSAAPPPPVQPRRSRAALFIGIGVAAAVLLGGGAFAAVRLWTAPTGVEPEQVLPGTVAAFARIDLDPALSQQKQLLDLVRKFPGRKGTTADVKRDLIDEANIPGLTYDAAKPWLGDRLGIALWKTDSGYVTLYALASTDDSGAKAALAKAKLTFELSDGYAVVAVPVGDAKAPSAALDAVRVTKKLAATDAYTSVVKKLPANQVAIGWADGPGVLAAGKSLKEGFPATLDGQSVGQVALGVQAVPDGLELRVAQSVPSTLVPKNDLVKQLETLPGNAAVAAVVQPLNDSPTIKKSMDDAFDAQVDQQLGALRGLLDKKTLDTVLGGIKGLFGATLSVAVTDLVHPAVQVTADGPDEATAGKLRASLGLFKALVDVDGTGQKTTITYGDYHPQGALADNELYRAAMAGRPATTSVVGYADMRKVFAASTTMTDEERADLAPVQALGVMVGADGALVRLVIR